MNLDYGQCLGFTALAVIIGVLYGFIFFLMIRKVKSELAGLGITLVMLMIAFIPVEYLYRLTKGSEWAIIYTTTFTLILAASMLLVDKVLVRKASGATPNRQRGGEA